MGCTLSCQKVGAPAADPHVRKSLGDLPDELLEIILREACTDGGRAGCTLSLVSRRIHNIGAPFRYRSIALSGDAQMRAFRELVGVLQARERPVPPVEALFLQRVWNTAGCRWRGPAKTWFDTTGIALEGQSRSGQRAGTTRMPEADGFETNDHMLPIGSLLSVLAPTLRSLALIINCPRWVNLVPVTLSSLTELTCLFVSDTSLNAPYPEQLGLAQKLPAVRRLHLVGPVFSARFCRLRELPPALTHLRLTGDAHPEEDLTWLSTPAPGQPTPKLWPPRSLRRILISPDEWLGVVCMEEVQPMHWWSAAQSGVDITHRVRIVREPAPYGAQQVYKHWLERLVGRRGCWVSGDPLTDKVAQSTCSDYGVY
jgi:hypothetical protein